MLLLYCSHAHSLVLVMEALAKADVSMTGTRDWPGGCLRTSAAQGAEGGEKSDDQFQLSGPGLIRLGKRSLALRVTAALTTT